jgi:DNA-directed RNA polymerase II subunit RPB1
MASTAGARQAGATTLTQQSENFGYSAVRLRRIVRLQFGVVNPAELVRLYSAFYCAWCTFCILRWNEYSSLFCLVSLHCNPSLDVFAVYLQRQYSVTQAVTINGRKVPAGVTRYETMVNGQAVYGGANDPRLGNLHDKSDPGYFGHLELAKPVYHQGFITVTLKVLRCVCFHCGRMRMQADEFKFIKCSQIKSKKRRLDAFHELLRAKKKCDYCQGHQPKYTKTDLHLVADFPDETGVTIGGDSKQSLSGETVVKIFRLIREDDIRLLGLDVHHARPDWLLVQVLPVPPLHVRPSVQMGGGTQSSEDDLTHQLVNVVKCNLSLQQAVTNGEPAVVVEQFELALQHNVAAFMDNETRGVPQITQRSGRPLKTITQRLKGKEGRIRGNLMGKRVDFSARTVITADPNLGIHQVGVPRSVAMNLTVPIKVTAFNVNELQQLVANGPTQHPGAKHIIRGDGTRIDLRYVKNKSELLLAHGWVVERHLRDDDVVLFNRQPSLHKMSIMGHRAKVLDWSTFRLNLSCTVRVVAMAASVLCV